MKKLTKKQIELWNKTERIMKDNGLKESQDYEIFGGQDIDKVSKEINVCLNIQFRKEENEKSIKALKELGWEKDKLYKNHNGSPAFFCSDLFQDDGELEKNVQMIRMKYKNIV